MSLEAGLLAGSFPESGPAFSGSDSDSCHPSPFALPTGHHCLTFLPRLRISASPLTEQILIFTSELCSLGL